MQSLTILTQNRTASYVCVSATKVTEKSKQTYINTGIYMGQYKTCIGAHWHISTNACFLIKVTGYGKVLQTGRAMKLKCYRNVHNTKTLIMI